MLYFEKVQTIVNYLVFKKNEINTKQTAIFSCSNLCEAIPLWNWHTFTEGRVLPPVQGHKLLGCNTFQKCSTRKSQTEVKLQNLYWFRNKKDLNLLLIYHYKSALGHKDPSCHTSSKNMMTLYFPNCIMPNCMLPNCIDSSFAPDNLFLAVLPRY